MPSIDTGALLRDIGTAALGAVGAGWPKIRDFASDELQKIAATTASIEVQKRKGEISEDEAKMLVDIRENALRSVLLGAEGLSALTLEATVNAIMGVVKGAINTATGFKIL